MAASLGTPVATTVTTASTSWSITLPSGLHTDGVILVGVFWDAVNSGTPNTPSGWTAIGTPPLDDTAGDTRSAFYVKRVTDPTGESGSSLAFTLTGGSSGNAGGAVAVEIFDSDTAALTHAQASHADGGGTSSHTSGALTTTDADCLVVLLTGLDASAGQTANYAYDAPLTAVNEWSVGLAIQIGLASAVEASAVSAKSYPFQSNAGLQDAAVGWVLAFAPGVTSSPGTMTVGTATATAAAFGDLVALQFAAPVADVSDGSWTGQDAGTDLWTYLDETTPSDADYIRSSESPATADVCKVRLAAMSDPGVHTGHILRYRFAKSAAAGDPIDLVVTLYDSDGTTVIASQQHQDIAAGFIEGSFTLTEGEAATITGYAAGLVVGVSAVEGA